MKLATQGYNYLLRETFLENKKNSLLSDILKKLLNVTGPSLAYNISANIRKNVAKKCFLSVSQPHIFLLVFCKRFWKRWFCKLSNFVLWKLFKSRILPMNPWRILLWPFKLTLEVPYWFIYFVSVASMYVIREFIYLLCKFLY